MWLGNCDPYVKVYLNNVKVFKTTTKDDATYLARYYETFTSNKIRKNSAIRIEVWDENVAFNSRMFGWNTTIPDLLVNGDYAENVNIRYKNKLSTFSRWRDEFHEA